MRYSIQRKLILNYVQNSCEHPTADMVYQNVKKEIPNISLGTVYRNLNSLVEQGLIKKIIMPNEAERFDKTVHDHYHMYCTKCGKVIDVEDNLENNIKKIQQRTGYQILSHSLHYIGICDKCR